ncbi:MAG: M20/M25/M40 family metallo-hydrolase, partial [Mangrovicoccus sp.]
MAQLTAREILDKLVSFPTVSRDSNLDLIDWVEDYLNGFGIKAHRAYNEEGTKASLYAQIGPEGPGGVMLSGHVDVVPVDGQAWDTDPFQVVEKDGKLYGRGCCDMKGFDALALAAVPLALERGIKRPLQIALSRDEEVGVIGTAPMLRHMAETGFAMPREVIVGEQQGLGRRAVGAMASIGDGVEADRFATAGGVAIGDRLGGVVHRDRATEGDASLLVHLPNRRLEVLGADVVEV